jgi:hypothetical protein
LSHSSRCHTFGIEAGSFEKYRHPIGFSNLFPREYRIFMKNGTAAQIELWRWMRIILRQIILPKRAALSMLRPFYEKTDVQI